MSGYGFLVDRMLGTGAASGRRKVTSRVRLQVVATKLRDPLGTIESAADRMERMDGRTPPHAWMQRAARRARTPLGSRDTGLQVYDGRACCFEHLTAYEGRPDMKLPLETTCPECRTVYEIAMKAIRVRI